VSTNGNCGADFDLDLDRDRDLDLDRDRDRDPDLDHDHDLDLDLDLDLDRDPDLDREPAVIGTRCRSSFFDLPLRAPGGVRRSKNDERQPSLCLSTARHLPGGPRAGGRDQGG